MYSPRATEQFSAWLENFLDYERIRKKEEFSLETMKFLVNRFNHPESAFKSVHVAGSKGKGSVSSMLSCILDAAGFSCGLYTSPHILDFTERIACARGLLDEAVYNRAARRVMSLVDSIIPGTIPGGAEPSWFELVTLFGFESFREAGLEWAVIETGLGGRLDATNVVYPNACVLTPVELEHTEYLGNTIEKIAAEKAGIIKKKVPVFLAEQTSNARKVFERVAASTDSPCFSMDDAIRTLTAKPGPDGLDIELSFNRLPGGCSFLRPISVRIPMAASIQGHNAALAAYTVKYLFPDLSEETIEKGLSRAWLPCRFEIISKNPPVVIDGAHTLRSIQMTIETFKAVFPGDAHLLFACAADKDAQAMAACFADGFSRITITRPGDKKTSDIEKTARAFDALDNAQKIIEANWEKAIEEAMAKASASSIPLLITGSFYLAAEAKKICSRAYQGQGN